MKIDAYNEQKRISEMFAAKDMKTETYTGSISGYTLSQAVSFEKGKDDRGFLSSNYGDVSKQSEGGMSFEDVASNAQLIKDNMKAICNKMDLGEVVTMDEEGVDINDADVDEIVTVSKQIRIKLAAAGVEGIYTGDIDSKDIQSVMGDKVGAQALENSFKKYGYPFTEDNMKQAKEALDEFENLDVIDIDARAYLMENGLSLSISNIYTANHAGTYGVDSGISESGWNAVKDQISQFMEVAGVEVNDASMAQMKQLAMRGTGINAYSIETYKNIDEVNEIIKRVKSGDMEVIGQVADTIVLGMVEGNSASQTVLAGGDNAFNNAVKAVNAMDSVTMEVLSAYLEKGDMTLEALAKIKAEYVEAENNTDQEAKKITSNGTFNLINPLDLAAVPSGIENVKGYRLLQETRLMMTVNSAYMLEKAGVSVNTSELSELVEALKNAEADSLSKVNGVKVNDVMRMLRGLEFSPCDAIGRFSESKEVSLAEIEAEAVKSQAKYEAASKSYETMSTQVRTDLGDRIDKAIAASSESIIKELDMDDTEENRRAVRILAYNSLEVNVESMERVKEIDQNLNNLFYEMTPQVVLKLIRSDVNVMGTDIAALSDMMEDVRGDMDKHEKFSEFIYRMDRNNGMSSEEREKMMGVYTAMKKLTNDDGKAAGAMMNQGLDMNLDNFLTAYMTRKDAGIDSYAGDEATQKRVASKLEYYKELFDDMQNISDEAVEQVMENNISNTIENYTASQYLLNDSAYVYRTLYTQMGIQMSANDNTLNNSNSEKKIGLALDRFLRSMDSKKNLQKEFEELGEETKNYFDTLEEDGILDIKMFRQMGQGMNFLGEMAQNNTFYIPYDGNENMTSIKLSVVENSEEKGMFTIDMTSENKGHIQVCAKVNDNKISAFVLMQKGVNQDIISEMTASMEKGLEALGFDKAVVNKSVSDSFPDASNGSASDVETKKLFAAAKVIIECCR